MITDLKVYELENKSNGFFSNGVRKCMKSLFKPWWHPARNKYLQRVSPMEL